MQNICSFQIFSKCPLLYPKFVQIFQIGLKHTTNFQGLANFWNNDCFWIFFKRFSIKFCIRKSNRFFSIHWVSPLKMAQCQNRRYESEKMTLNKTGIMQVLIKPHQKTFHYQLALNQGILKLCCYWPLTSWSSFTGLFFTLKSPFLAQKNVGFFWNNFIRILWFTWDLRLVLFDSCKNVVFGKMLVFVNILGFPGVT